MRHDARARRRRGRSGPAALRTATASSRSRMPSPKRGSAGFPRPRRAVVAVAVSGRPLEMACARRCATRSRPSSRAAASISACPISCSRPRTCPCGGQVPVVLFEHNVEYLIWQRLAALESSPWRRALFEIEWRKLRAREADACRRADLTIAVSEDDRRRLEALGPGMPRAQRFPPASTPATSCPTARRTPRPAGVQRLDGLASRTRTRSSTSPMPSCRGSARTFPTSSFTIVGRNPSARLREVARRAGSIVVTGHGRRRAAVDWRGGRLCRPAPRRRRHAAQDFRGAGDGQARRLDHGRRRRAGARAGPPLRGRRRTGRLRERRRLAAARSGSGAQALGQAGRDLVEARYSWTMVAREFEQRCEEVVADRGSARAVPSASSQRVRFAEPAHVRRPGPAKRARLKEIWEPF